MIINKPKWPILVSKKRGSEDKTEEIINGDEYLNHGKLVFIGDGGVGKTRFMRELEKKAGFIYCCKRY